MRAGTNGCPAEIRERLAGPIPSLKTPFLRDTAPNVVAIKDDMCGEFARKMSLLAHAYWAAISSNNAAEVRRIIRDHDNPFFELVMGLPGGFNAGIQAVLELKHIAQRWRRKPYRSLSDQELELLAHGLKKLGLLE